MKPPKHLRIPNLSNKRFVAHIAGETSKEISGFRLIEPDGIIIYEMYTGCHEAMPRNVVAITMEAIP